MHCEDFLPLVAALDHALLIWLRMYENRAIPRAGKLGEFGTDLGLEGLQKEFKAI